MKIDINELEQPTGIEFTATNGTDRTYGSFYPSDALSVATITDYKTLSGAGCSTIPLADRTLCDAMRKDWDFDPKSVTWHTDATDNNDWESRLEDISCGRPCMYHVDHANWLLSVKQELRITTHISVTFFPEDYKFKYELCRIRVIYSDDTDAVWRRFCICANETPGDKEFKLVN